MLTRKRTQKGSYINDVPQQGGRGVHQIIDILGWGGGTSDWGIPLLYFELTTFLCYIMLNLKEITTEKTKKKSEYLNHVLRRVLNHVLNLKYLNHVLNVLNHLLRR